MTIRVVNLATSQQVVGIIAVGMKRFIHLSFVGNPRNQGACIMRENKPKSGSDCRFPVRKTPSKTVWFRNVKKVH